MQSRRWWLSKTQRLFAPAQPQPKAGQKTIFRPFLERLEDRLVSAEFNLPSAQQLFNESLTVARYIVRQAIHAGVPITSQQLNVDILAAQVAVIASHLFAPATTILFL